MTFLNEPFCFAFVDTQLNAFKYCYITLTIRFNIRNSQTNLFLHAVKGVQALLSDTNKRCLVMFEVSIIV